MARIELDPGKVNRPIQLLAVLITGLVILVSAFLTAGTSVSEPTWIKVLLFITAVALVPIFLGVIFLMWTKFRPQLQDDIYYSEWLKRQEERFRNFSPENVQSDDPMFSLRQVPSRASILAAVRNSTENSLGIKTPSTTIEEKRLRRYTDNNGIFLIHHWRPSAIKGQIADIVIEPTQHREGPLSQGLVESVTYDLGTKFFNGRTVNKCDKGDNFRLHISAYGPALCIAEVKIRGQAQPLILERYIDFDVDPPAGHRN